MVLWNRDIVNNNWNALHSVTMSTGHSWIISVIVGYRGAQGYVKRYVVRDWYRYMKEIEKVRRLERHQEKFKMRLAMQNKHSLLGHTRSARALERAKLDRCCFNTDKRQFTGCYGYVKDEETMKYVERNSVRDFTPFCRWLFVGKLLVAGWHSDEISVSH